MKKNVPSRSQTDRQPGSSGQPRRGQRFGFCVEEGTRSIPVAVGDRSAIGFVSSFCGESEETVGRCGGSSHQDAISQEHHGSRTRVRVGPIAVSTRGSSRTTINDDSRPHGASRRRGFQTPCPRGGVGVCTAGGGADRAPNKYCNCTRGGESVADHSRRVAAGKGFVDVRSRTPRRCVERWGVDENGDVDRPSRRRVAGNRTFPALFSGRVTCWLRGVRVGEASNPGPLSSDDEPLIPPTVPDEVVDALEFDLTPVARRRRLRLVGSQSAPAVFPNRFSVLLDSEGHARHASDAARASQDVASIFPLSPIPIRRLRWRVLDLIIQIWILVRQIKKLKRRCQSFLWHSERQPERLWSLWTVWTLKMNFSPELVG